jgi:hypothetical protein
MDNVRSKDDILTPLGMIAARHERWIAPGVARLDAKVRLDRPANNDGLGIVCAKVPSNFDPNAISCHGFAPAHSGGASIPAGRFLPRGTTAARQLIRPF